MCNEISWEEVVRGLEVLERGKAPGPDGIVSLVWQTGRGVCWYLSTRMVTVEK